MIYDITLYLISSTIVGESNFGAGFLKYFEKNQIVFLYKGNNSIIIRFNIFLILPLRNNGIQFMSPQDESEGKSVNDDECNV